MNDIIVVIVVIGLLAWPVLVVGGFVVVRKFERERAAREAAQTALAETRGDRDYWKSRAEQLIDAQLIRGGVGGPVMQPPAPKGADPMTKLLSGMAVSEIDSRVKPA
jgi:type II secretory pathway pseudopilin PulG